MKKWKNENVAQGNSFLSFHTENGPGVDFHVSEGERDPCVEMERVSDVTSVELIYE
jgi:hypothetical protein